MNVLFLTLADFNSLKEKRHAIYTDLLNEFRKHGHYICVISPVEARFKKNTYIVEEDSCKILRLKIGDNQQTSTLKKGVSTLTVESAYKKAIKKYFSDIKFDLILYTTPPITLCKPVEYVKRRDNAKSYLLLKDIFPQNSVDLGMLSKSGVKGEVYRRFRSKEKKLYDLSDRIGCMSEANVKYVLEHNSNVSADKIGVCPNSVSPVDMSASPQQRRELREKYDLPQDKKIFVYGGNLGRPQGVDFIIECLKKQSFDDVYFLIVGNGTEYDKIKSFADSSGKSNIKLLPFIPKDDYDRLVGSCDVGMIFLDHRFTIPNFPSRLLSYLQAKLPVLCATDKNTDIGVIAEENGFGIRCISDNTDQFIDAVNKIKSADFPEMGDKGYEYMLQNFTVEKAYEIIIS